MRNFLIPLIVCFSIYISRTSAKPGVKDLLNGAVETVKESYEQFKDSFSKAYNDPTPLRNRDDIFAKSASVVAEATGQAAQGLLDFAVKTNFLSYLTWEEYQEQYNGFDGDNLLVHQSQAPLYRLKRDTALPKSVDWREMGAVTSVKNQSGCGGCWAFAANGALEGQIFKKTGKLLDLSVQNLLDCADEEHYVNRGCEGGLVHTAFEYVRDKGLNSEEAYPFAYTKSDGTCKVDASNIVAKCKGYNRIPMGDEEALAAAVAMEGPVASAIDARDDLFRIYDNGIYHNPNCSSNPNHLTHAVLVVGYGTQDGMKYWLVKNSYSTGWGSKGFFKLRKDAGNHCGIATEAFIPFVE